MKATAAERAGQEQPSGDRAVPRYEKAGDVMPVLGPQWNALVRASDTPMPFVTWEWYRCWLDAFCSPDEAGLVIATRGDSLVGVLPLRVHGKSAQSGGLRLLTSWVNTHSFRWGMLCERQDVSAASALADQLAALENWDACYLNYAIWESRTLQAFLGRCRNIGFAVETIPDMQSPVMTVHDDWDEFLSSLPKKRRESERRKFRKLEKLGVRFEFATRRGEKLDVLLQDCWEISSRTWKQEKGSAIAADESRRAFYEDIANSDQDWIFVAVMYLEAKPVAFEYNLIFEGTMYSMKLGYDMAYADLSAGQVLRFRLFEWCIRNKIAFFDFMGHRARYKDQYADTHVEHRSIRIYSRSSRGRMLGTYRTRIRPHLVQIKRQLVAAKNKIANQSGQKAGK